MCIGCGPIAAMAASLGGLDALLFTGGVGERAPLIRSRAASGLGFLGVALDAVSNDRVRADREIGAAGAQVRTLVIAAGEDRQIAREVRHGPRPPGRHVGRPGRDPVTARPSLPPDDLSVAPDRAQRGIADALYEGIADLPIVSPHGHVDPRLLADPDATFGTPAELLVIPDHYIVRMLHSQGIAYEDLGIGPVGVEAETDHRQIWQLFADHLALFRGTPSSAWLAYELRVVFGVEEPLTSANAGSIYDELSARLAQPAYRPRALFDRFQIETLCTTDDAADPLDGHARDPRLGLDRRCPSDVPTGRGGEHRGAGWRAHLDALSAAVGRDDLDGRRARHGARGSAGFLQGVGRGRDGPWGRDGVDGSLDAGEAEAIFARGLAGTASADDARLFTGHMLIEWRPDERRGRPGHAAPRRCAPEPRPRRCSSASGRTWAPTSRSPPSSPGTCARCSNDTATTAARR